MTPGAILFMVLSWSFVLGLTLWSFARILHLRRNIDPDGIGPAVPPEQERTEGRKAPSA